MIETQISQIAAAIPANHLGQLESVNAATDQ
jgi:hypothetical protein